ncbi:Lysophospholipase L2 [Streptococcus sp. DD10]|uniref:alpha/beta fold hydrolase n=1 Tax=Streptococcus sp. DD10 TaxID=1777878 RepID=UPI00079270E3|nr:alpha/beta hydrolase [Streptococcus sp. DD10]KXT72339.1 Lysophospholipase L2 [Streptococcus sp. DD10]
MKYLITITLLALIGLALFFWTSQKKPTTSQQETTHSNTTQVEERTVSSLSPTEDIVEEAYSVAYDDKNLVGTITAPRDYQTKQLPTIVISHGFNNTHDMYRSYMQALAKQGFLVYGFDFYGGSRRSKSGGQDMLQMSIQTELTDLSQVMDKLRSESFVNPKQMSLIGVSQGGVVASLYASTYPDHVHKLALIFPAFVLFDDVKETYQELGSPAFENLPDSLTHHGSTLGKIYLIDALDGDAPTIQEKITAPTLIVHGTNDTIVPYRYALEASQTIPNSQFVTVEGGGHWIDDTFSQTALPALQEFLKD